MAKSRGRTLATFIDQSSVLQQPYLPIRSSDLTFDACESSLTSKARKSKPTHIEKVLPITRIVELFRQRFHDPYLNPEAELGLADFQSAFSDISTEELEEALAHWTLYPGQRVLSTKKVEVEGKEMQVWYIHGLHEENAALERLTRHGSVPV